MGEELIYRSRQRVRVQCPDSGDHMTTGSLAVHWKNQNGMDKGGRKQWETPPHPPTPRWRASDFLYLISSRDGTAGMTSRGVEGAVVDADGDDSEFSSHICLGHHDHPRGWKNPRPPVPLV